MAISTSAGALVYICETATTATSQSALAALTYIAVGKVESAGQIGPNGQDVTFTPLGGQDVQHLKGSTDNGTTQIVCARDPLDPGQLALKAASLTKLEYALKIVLSDGADANDTDTTFYIRGPVMGSQTNIGGANQVTQSTFNVGNNVFIEDTSEAVS